MEKLTFQEEEAMRFIWKLGPCYVKDVVGCYDEPLPPYTTVASIITNLKRKGYLKAEKFGNTYRYTPLVKQEEYTKNSVSSLVKNYFANSYKEMVSFFAKEQKISKDELNEIINLIEKEDYK